MSVRESIKRACTTLIVAAGAFALPAAAADAPRSLAQEVQDLKSESEIRYLLVEYGRLLDTHDFVGYSQLFTKDGEWTGTLGTAKTPAGILALMQKSFKGAPYSTKTVSLYHLDTNMLIHVDGDHATAISKWTAMRRSPDNKLVAGSSGQYNDTLVRENGKWKFLLRSVSTFIPNPK